VKIRNVLAPAAGTAALLVGTANVATAASLDEVPSVKVRYHDLNLNTEQGNTVLYQRIVRAAVQVCGRPDIRDLSALAAATDCQHAAVARAVDFVHSPMLAAIYGAHLTRG
jgi:UrcA family protein